MVILQKFQSSLKQFFCHWLSSFLPDRTKRLMLFASLAAYQENTRFDKNTVRKLNSIMALSEQDKALNLPIHLSKMIWSGERGSRVLYSIEKKKSPETVEKRVEEIMAEVPSWLKYQNIKGLREDLTRLIVSQEELVASN